MAACGDRSLQPASPTPLSRTISAGRVVSHDYHEMPETPETATLTLVPEFGPLMGGTRVNITAIGFMPGATVTFGVVPAAETTFVDSGLITAVAPPAAEAGWADVYVQNPDGRMFALRGGFTYTSTLAPGVEPTVTITELGASPKAIEVVAGSRITVVNNQTRPHDIRSDPHPVHTDCPELNEIGVLEPGAQGQSGAFLLPRTCGFHDHIEHHDDRWRARVVIVPAN